MFFFQLVKAKPLAGSKDTQTGYIADRFQQLHLVFQAALQCQRDSICTLDKAVAYENVVTQSQFDRFTECQGGNMYV